MEVGGAGALATAGAAAGVCTEGSNGVPPSGVETTMGTESSGVARVRGARSATVVGGGGMVQHVAMTVGCWMGVCMEQAFFNVNISL